jgi:serine/threonine protein kinase
VTWGQLDLMQAGSCILAIAVGRGHDDHRHRVQDIWALGVIIYEALTGMRGVPTHGGIHQICSLADGAPYPWEADQTPPAFAKSRVRPVVEVCLERKPSRRATAGQVLGMIDRIGQSTSVAIG